MRPLKTQQNLWFCFEIWWRNQLNKFSRLIFFNLSLFFKELCGRRPVWSNGVMWISINWRRYTVNPVDFNLHFKATILLQSCCHASSVLSGQAFVSRYWQMQFLGNWAVAQELSHILCIVKPSSLNNFVRYVKIVRVRVELSFLRLEHKRNTIATMKCEN